MTQNSSTQLLSVGNIVSTGVTLYRSHFGNYATLAVRAALWSIPGLIFFVLAVSLLVTLSLSNVPTGAATNSNPFGVVPVGVRLVLVVVLAVPSIYCGAKSLLNAAMICRLAFGELTNQPETMQEAYRQLEPRLWGFFWVAVQIGFYFFLLYVATSISAAIAGVVLIGVLSLALGQVASAIISFGVIIIVGVVIVLRVLVRWVLAEVPLAIEENITSSTSINRSWKLTAGSASRILWVVSIAFLVTIPVFSLTNVLPSLAINQFSADTPIFWIVYLISLGIQLAGSVMLLPFWQTVKAVLYYDLRSRREGFGLNLGDRAN